MNDTKTDTTGREAREQTLNALRQYARNHGLPDDAIPAFNLLASCVVLSAAEAAEIAQYVRASRNDSHLLDGRNFDPAPFDAALARLGETP